MIRAALEELGTQIRALVSADVLVTLDATEIRPALDDELPVIWIFPPDTAAYPDASHIELTAQPVIISPHLDPIDGLEQIEEILALLLDPLSVTETVFDTLQFGGSNPFPAGQFTTTLLIERP